MISVECPACGQSLSIPDAFAGQSGRCNYCGSIVAVPDPATGVGPSSTSPSLPFASPRRPARPGAGMIATEEEYAGGAGASLGRILVLGVAALVVAACVLPAIVMGFTAEPKPTETFRERSLPLAREGAPDTENAAVAPPPVMEDPIPVELPPIDEKRIVMVGPQGGIYHRRDCGLVPTGARATTHRLAIDKGLEPCPDCGG